MEGESQHKNNQNYTVGTPNKVGNYYKKLTLKNLTDDFYQKIIELENEIQLSQIPNMETIKELGSYYKKAIELFSGVSDKKIKFYMKKLSTLMVGSNKLQKQKDKKPSKWSEFMVKHKKNTGKLMLFLQIDSTKQEVPNKLENQETTLHKGFEKLKNDLNDQENKFLENKKKKQVFTKINLKSTLLITPEQIKENNELVQGGKIIRRSDSVDSLFKDFIKKFHYSYLHSKLFSIPIDALSDVFENIFDHKVQKFYYFQDQIKQFELLLNDKESGEHDEGVELLIKQLQDEKKAYYLALESLSDNTVKKIISKCEGTNLQNDYEMQKYLQELMIGVSKLF